MRVITLARKPLQGGSVAENVLRYGTGGLNIDSCRVAGVVPPTIQGVSIRIYGGGKGAFPDGYQESHPHQAGRWPSNVILEHRPECRQVGTKKIKSDGHWRDAGGFGIYDGGWGDRIQDEGHRLADNGLEEVPAWDCHPDCPVKTLDDQSEGKMHSAGVARGATREAGKTGMFPMDGDGHRFGDSGGASRFFKQVKGS